MIAPRSPAPSYIHRQKPNKAVVPSVESPKRVIETSRNECSKLDSSEKCLLVACLNLKFRPMTPELERALKRHTQWFGSYKASGELKKIQVWLVVNGGQIEFLTPGNSYKVKRARKNPRVMCYVGSKDGPAISGTAQIITNRSEVARVYRGYWKTHPMRMAIVIGLRLWIEMLLNKRVVVRVQPDEPNPLEGLTDPAT